MVMKRPIMKSSSSRPPAVRHVNSFVTDEDRERERQATAEREAAGDCPPKLATGDESDLQRRMVGDCLDRYDRSGG